MGKKWTVDFWPKTVTPVGLPDSGFVFIYFKADNLLYAKDDTGIEHLLSPDLVGDMFAAVYDPTGVAGDAFSMNNMAEGANTKILTDAERTILSNTSGVNTGDDKQALISFRKTAGQTVSTLSGETDNIITFPVANPAPTATAVIDFDGTVLEIKQRHPSKLSRLLVGIILSSSHNSGVSVTVNLRVSIDGGTTFPVIANTETFGMLPKSGSTNSTLFVAIGEWVSPQPSLVPVFLKTQVFADVASVVTVEPGSTFNLNGIYK